MTVFAKCPLNRLGSTPAALRSRDVDLDPAVHSKSSLLYLKGAVRGFFAMSLVTARTVRHGFLESTGGVIKFPGGGKLPKLL